VVKAALAVPAVTVPGLFFVKPVPVTATSVPLGPDVGDRVRIGVAADAGLAPTTAPAAMSAPMTKDARTREMRCEETMGVVLLRQ